MTDKPVFLFISMFEISTAPNLLVKQKHKIKAIINTRVGFRTKYDAILNSIHSVFVSQGNVSGTVIALKNICECWIIERD